MNGLESCLEEIAFISRRCTRELTKNFDEGVAICERAIRTGRKIIAAGNGGSAAQAEHFVAELVGRFTQNRGPIPAIALGSNHALSSALNNDMGYAVALVQEFAGIANDGDVLLGFSTSGTSPNLVNLFAFAGTPPEFPRVAIIGGNPSAELRTLSNIVLAVPSLSTARIQEIHLVICHALAGELERRLQDEPRFRFHK